MTRRVMKKVDQPKQEESKEGVDERVELDEDQMKSIIDGQGSPEGSDEEADVSKDVKDKGTDKPQKKSRFGSFFSSGSQGKKQEKE